jgi:hypothetical protein
VVGIGFTDLDIEMKNYDIICAEPIRIVYTRMEIDLRGFGMVSLAVGRCVL